MTRYTSVYLFAKLVRRNWSIGADPTGYMLGMLATVYLLSITRSELANGKRGSYGAIEGYHDIVVR